MKDTLFTLHLPSPLPAPFFLYITTSFFKKPLLIYFPTEQHMRMPISLRPQQKWILPVFYILGKS